MDKESLMETTLSEEDLFHGRIFDMHRDRIRLPDGRESTREVVHHKTGGVCVVPLTEDGKVISFTVDGKEHFDGDTSNHCHLVCSSCHSITDIFEPDFSSFSKQIEQNLGCKTSYVQIVLFGRCKACLEKNKN